MLLQILALLFCAAALVSYVELVPRGRGTERGAVGWADLLPAAGQVARTSPTVPLPGLAGGGDLSTGFGGRFVELGRRALGAYQGWQGAPVSRFDVSESGQYDDQEVAKMIAQYGAIPADSDLGQLAVSAGARSYKQRVRFSDGSHASIDVVQIGSARGGADRPENKPRAGRKALTSYRMGTAAWVMRKLHAQQRLGRRLAKVAKSLGT